MSNESRLEQLEKKLQYLMDRSAILDCIARNARGCDRHDSDLLTSSYSKEGIDEHGYSVTTGDKYPESANKAHTGGSLHNMHNITTHSCEIRGDEAHCESYVIGLFLNPDGKGSRLIAGRYADRLVRQNGEWRIALRRSTVEILMTGDATILTLPMFKEMGYIRGTRDKTDVSYQRPLKLDSPVDRWDSEKR